MRRISPIVLAALASSSANPARAEDLVPFPASQAPSSEWKSTVGSAPTCGPAELAELYAALFPPTPEAERVAALAKLGACRDAKSVGPLAAAMRSDPSARVRVAAVDALTKNGSAPAKEAIASAVTDWAGVREVWKAAASALLDMHETALVHRRAIDPEVQPELRVIAMELLERAAPLTQEELRFIAASPQPTVAPAAQALLAQRALPENTRPQIVEREPVPSENPARVPVEGTPSADEEDEEEEATPPPPPAPPVVATEEPAPEPTPEAKPLEAPVLTSPVASPAGPPDGTALAIVSSTVAGVGLMTLLSELGQQSSTGVLLLTGTAGAVIGGGTAFGLTRFRVWQPTMSQAGWYTNVTGWGTLAGLTLYSGSGVHSEKVKWGLLVGGEAAGMVAGILSTTRWDWDPAQLVLADSLVLGAALADAGGKGLAGQPLGISPVAAIGVVPVMVGSAIVSRYLHPTGNDLHLISTLTLAGGWTGLMLASGFANEGFLTNPRSVGGLLTGLGAGYLASVAASAFTEVDPTRSWLTLTSVLLGSGLGAGASMMARPTEPNLWSISAGFGGVALSAAIFAAAPYLNLRLQVVPMMLVGAAYGAGVMAISGAAAHEGPVFETEATQYQGSLAVGAVTGSLIGLVASRWFEPTALDYPALGVFTLYGLSAGLGVARVATAKIGPGDQIGSLIGAAVGAAGGAALLHDHLRGVDFGAGLAGGAYGAILGSVIPSLAQHDWTPDRAAGGGTLLGVGVGALGVTALTHLLNPSPAQVVVPSVAGLFGLGMGAGLGLMWPFSYVNDVGPQPGDNSQAARIGLVAGPVALTAGVALLDQKLHLSNGLPMSAIGLGWMGSLYGLEYGLLLAGVSDQHGVITQTPAARLGGGILLGVTTGLATGLILSKVVSPEAPEHWLAFGSSVLGSTLGLGVSLLATTEGGRSDTLGFLLGSGSGLALGAWAAHNLRLTAADVFAGSAGLLYGGLIGSMVPSLHRPDWPADRTTGGATLLGFSALSAGAAAFAHWQGYSPAQVGVPVAASTFGILMGLGLGLAIDTSTSQASRIGMVSGTVGLAAASILAEPRLHLAEGLGPDAGNYALMGILLGTSAGLQLAPVLQPDFTPAGAWFGGALFGLSAFTASGLVLSKFMPLSGADDVSLLSGSALGISLGWGVGLLATPTPGRGEAAARLAGELLGIGAGVLERRFLHLDGTDALAGTLAGGYGLFLGLLAPSLNQPEWVGDRTTAGWTLLATPALAVAGMTLRHATGVPSSTVGLGMLGAFDGSVAGLGVAMLANGLSQSNRIGLVAGSLAGLGVGLGLWPRTQVSAEDGWFIAYGTALAGWTAAWIPTLGHESITTSSPMQVGGAILTGLTLGSFATSLVGPRLHVDPDLTQNAAGMHALFSLAGLGAGLLASSRDDVPVGAMLGTGLTGLLVGGALHNSINLTPDDVPLITLSTLEGAWIGAWLPFALMPLEQIGARQEGGSLLAVTFASAGIATLTASQLKLHGWQAGYGTLGATLGAGLLGGAGLVAEDLPLQAKVGMMLGGTLLGTVSGTYFSDRFVPESLPLLRTGIGALLGASEGLTFAWAGRANTPGVWGGSALVGASVGGLLGLTSSAYTNVTAREIPWAAGFMAWGAWMGSFAGAFVNPDAHQVTFGGLLGANLGALGGYALLKSNLVKPEDFGWLSLFGGIGTVLGGGIGAPFSTKADPRPALAGLAIGPLIGMAAGYFLLPALHGKARSAEDAEQRKKVLAASGRRLEE